MAHWDKYEGRNPLRDRDAYRVLNFDPDDRLFKGDPKSGVWIDLDSPVNRYLDDRPSWYAYVWGFKEAADRLVEDIVLEGDSSVHVRFLGNPILALYRHSVELAIKSILITSGATNKPEVFRSHDLNRLWKQAVEAMDREDSASAGDDSLTMVSHLITELNEADSNSQNFRYGVDTNLKAFERRVTHVDVVNLRRVMVKLAAALESCDTWLYETQQDRWRYEAEIRRELYAELREYDGAPDG